MSTVQEIEAAIRALSQKDKERLAADLPAILPGFNSDWELKEVIAAASSMPAEQTPEDEKIVEHVVVEYRTERRRKR